MAGMAKIHNEDECNFKIPGKDNINPDHYKNQTSLECIEAMEIIFGRDAVIDFCVCNAWKYIWRWKHKNGKEDLKKSAWYLTHAFDMMSSDDKNFDTLKGMINYVARQGINVNSYAFKEDNLEESKINEKYSDWKDAPWLNQKILEESKRIKKEESDG